MQKPSTHETNSDNLEAKLFLLSYVNVELNCVDESMRNPESFVRGGPTLTFFSFFFRSDEGRGYKYHKKQAIIGPPAKHNLNGISLAG